MFQFVTVLYDGTEKPAFCYVLADCMLKGNDAFVEIALFYFLVSFLPIKIGSQHI